MTKIYKNDDAFNFETIDKETLDGLQEGIEDIENIDYEDDSQIDKLFNSDIWGED